LSWSDLEAAADQVALAAASIAKRQEGDAQTCLAFARDLANSLKENDSGYDKAMVLNAALQDMLHASQSLEDVEHIQDVSQRLKERMIDMQLMTEDMLSNARGTHWGQQAVTQEEPSMKRRLSFELERKVELLSRKVQSKTAECQKLQKSNAMLRAELGASVKQGEHEDSPEMEEIRAALKGFKDSMIKVEGADFTPYAFESLRNESLSLLEKVAEHLHNVYTVNRRQAMLLEAAEKEAAEHKASAQRMQAELQASRRLQEELEKASKLPRFSSNQERLQLQAEIRELEEEVLHWQHETEEARSGMSDQMSENDALRKQLSAAEDKCHQLLAQFHNGSDSLVGSLKQQLEEAVAEIEKLQVKAARSEVAKAEMQQALEELKEDLGALEFNELEKEVDAEMEIAEQSVPDWIVHRVAAGNFHDADAGLLAKKLTAMIRRSAAQPSSDAGGQAEEADDTEAIVTDFVDKACEWQAEVQSLSQELGRANAAAEEWKSRATSQEAFIRAFEGSKAPSLASDSSSNSDAESPRSSGTAASCQNDAESDASSRSMIKLEMDIARLQSRVAGLQTEGKWKHKRILQLEEELSKLMIELENSEVQQAKLEAELEIAKEPATSSWLAASRQFLMDGIESDSAKSSPRMLGRSITGLQKLCHVAQEDVDDGEELTWLSESVEGSATPRSYVGKKKGDSCSSASASDVGSPMEEDCSATATLEDFIWGGNEPLTP